MANTKFCEKPLLFSILGVIFLVLISESQSSLLPSLQLPLPPSQPPLVSLNTLLPTLARIDTETLTVSGFSSGAFMSVMLHYIFSSKFQACGSFAGGPFGILYNTTGRDFLPQYVANGLVNVAPYIGRSTEFLEQQAIQLAAQGIIDPISNLNVSKSFLYQGGLDPINPTFLQLSQKVIDMYNFFGSDLKTLLIGAGTHCVPTDNYGLPCPILDPVHDFVNNCGTQSISTMFSHFFGPDFIIPASSTATPTGTFYNFDQNQVAPSGNAIQDFMNPIGGIYIPAACQVQTATCKLHVALHGCVQSTYSNLLGDNFAKRAGYFQVADVNNMIVVYPRAATVDTSIQLVPDITTSIGCWDWFGLTTTETELKGAPQIKTITNILNKLIGTTLFN